MRVFVTGASGYVARATLPYLLGDDEVESVVGYDLRRPSGFDGGKFEFVEGDVRDGAAVLRAMRGADVVVHMAFIVGEIKDKKKIYSINVEGSRRVMEAAEECGVKKFVLASSITAYGTHAGRGVLREDMPLRGNRESYYSHTKMLVENMLDDFVKRNPDVTVSRLRPTVLCGAGTDNFFLDLIEQKAIIYPDTNKKGLPLVHEDDVGRAFYLAVKKDVSGAFNIAGGMLPFETISSMVGKQAVGLPYWLMKLISDVGYLVGFAPVSSHWAVLLRYPLEADCERAEKELGWRAEKTPVEAFRELVSVWKAK